MKKFILIAFMFVVWLGGSGFTEVNTTMANSTNGNVIELISISYNDATLTAVNDNNTSFAGNLNSALTATRSKIAQNFIYRITNNASLTEEEKEQWSQNIKIVSNVDEKNKTASIKFTFESVKVYDYFCNLSDEPATRVEEGVFIVKSISANLPKQTHYFNTITNIYTPTSIYLYNELISGLSEEYGASVSGLETPEKTYTYATSYHRVHSNASTTYYSNGYFYHTWLNVDDSSVIEIWRTGANKPVWYTILLGSALVFMGGLWLFGKGKKKKDDPTQNKEEPPEIIIGE